MEEVIFVCAVCDVPYEVTKSMMLLALTVQDKREKIIIPGFFVIMQFVTVVALKVYMALFQENWK